MSAQNWYGNHAFACGGRGITSTDHPAFNINIVLTVGVSTVFFVFS